MHNKQRPRRFLRMAFVDVLDLLEPLELLLRYFLPLHMHEAYETDCIHT